MTKIRDALIQIKWRNAPPKKSCGECQHFCNDPRFVEAATPGLASFSSGDASVRADDGFCMLRDRYLSARASCAQYATRCG